MENGYPFLSRNLPLERTALYFDTDNITFNSIQADLAQTIVLWGPQLHLNGNIVGVQLELAIRYGGNTSDYRVTSWENNTFLIRIPFQLDRALVTLDMNSWCLDRDILWIEWNPNSFLRRQPFFSYRLEVIITGFPLPLWHEYFIMRLLLTLGDVIYVNEDNLNGSNKSCIQAFIRCVDLRAIPRFINVHFAHLWSECRVHIRDWGDMPYIPARIRSYLDFADPENPYGDDPSEADSQSHIRALAISCQDSLRDVFYGSSASSCRSQATNAAPPPTISSLNLKATLIIGGSFVFPEAMLLLLRMCLAIAIRAVQIWLKMQLNQNRFTRPVCMFFFACMKTRVNLQKSHPTHFFFQTAKYTSKISSYPIKSSNFLHAAHVSNLFPPIAPIHPFFFHQKPGASRKVLSYLNILFVPMHATCQVDSLIRKAPEQNISPKISLENILCVADEMDVPLPYFSNAPHTINHNRSDATYYSSSSTKNIPPQLFKSSSKIHLHSNNFFQSQYPFYT